ncbi:helix-turn-helix domain-containing protein [Schaalia sp. lx-100]|uniref:helix-turn-helix domain-containing protein n=1 Tax=Schaalia sp. lx-100 TaxID=2899081 RepID=UPI002F2B5C86
MFTFKPLWKVLIDLEMSKTGFAEQCGISKSTLSKMGRDEYVSLEVIDRICRTLGVPVESVIKYVEETL